MQRGGAATNWHPASWKNKTVRQQPDYADEDALQAVLEQLASLPPLVNSWEIQRLKRQLAAAACGRGFLLQGGDCAERFDECRPDIIARRLKVLLQMSLVLVYGLKAPVVRVGRFAGQYAKPRSSPVQQRNGTTLPSYRGDIINRPAFTESARRPDPRSMLRAYNRSALTLNFVRSLIDGGFTDLHHPEYWDLDFISHSPLAAEYQDIVKAVGDAMTFVEAVSDQPLAEWRSEFYTSHEALLLAYEQAQTREVPHNPGWYNLTTHMPWIGMRTAQLESAHVEYCRGLSNPIGIKVGPSMTPSGLADLIGVLSPEDDPGRITLITRFGADQIEDALPPLIRAVQATGRTVLWCADPMHGNTEVTPSGRKTRRFENILAELEQAFDIHAAMGSRLGGVHFELTAENVTECVGGARKLNESDLERAYKSHVDPRLNGEQALEMAFCIVRKRRQMGRDRPSRDRALVTSP